MSGVALIGAGMWGPKIAAAAARAGLPVVTVFARDETKRAEFAESVGCEASPSFEAAVSRDDVEGVLLVTPNDVHEEQTLACAALGKHVFVEKPIADSVEAGARMREACAAAGVTLMVGHAFRRLGSARRARELVESGALGRVVLAEANFSLPGRFPPAAWRAHRERNPGGPIMQLGIHAIDTLHYLLGPVAGASGRFAHVHAAADIDDVGVVTLEFASGALGVVTGSYVSPHTMSMRLLGSEGVLDVWTDMSVWPNAPALDGVTTMTLGGETVSFEARDMLAEELAEFGRCMAGVATPETGADEGLVALGAVLSALESDAAGRVAVSS